MSQATLTAMSTPEFTLGDRLRKARMHAGLSQLELADRIAISVRTVTTYERETRRPQRIVVRAWALATGVPLEWFGPEWCPRVDSNHQPADYRSAQVRIAA